MLGKLLPFGYAADSGSGTERLSRLMTEHDALLVDIRFNPVSRWRPEWNKNHLSALWGKRYLWKHSLGNINYRADGPIALANERDGIAWLVALLQTGRSVVLLCACKSYGECHRRYVVDRVREQLPGVEVKEG